MSAQRGHPAHQGIVYAAPLEGGSLDAHVASIEAEGGVVSRQPVDVDGHAAIELLTQGTFHVYDLYIARGDEVVIVSFRTEPEAFDDQLAAFRAAGRSVRFQ
ncbi:hypothetical protein ACERK3_08000 [Phycisphaerales bacterium AB-hyl4]|uniref:Uncharacterized protein n=1 Tax=Natronomicrosphaera hydrolytica TaxID=3242702 RepID=A0ABV4U4I1_9BACT